MNKIVIITKYEGDIPLYEGNAGKLVKSMEQAIRFNNSREADSYCLNVHGHTNYVIEQYEPIIRIV